MRAALWLLLLSFCCTAYATGDTKSDAQFEAIHQAEWQWRLREYPQLATTVGVHEFDDQLGHVDAASQQRRLKYLRKTAAQLEKIPSESLSPAAQINFAIYSAQIRNAVDGLALRAYLLPMTSDASFYADLANLPQIHPFNTVADYQRYLKRLRAMPRYFAEHIDLLNEGLRRGMTLPQRVLNGREAPIQTIINAKLEKTPYYAPFVAIPATIPAAVATELRKQGRASIKEAVIPAHQTLLKFFVERYRPGARNTLAAHDLPSGEAYYALQIREFTTLDLSADEIHAIGEREVKRIRAEMEKVIVDSGFKGSFAEYLTFLRTDPQFYAKTPREMMMAASYIAKKIDGELPKYFTVLPRQPYGVVPVPANIAPYYTSGRYSPAPEGGRSAGFYWVNTYRLNARPLYALPALTLHEAVPGHHLQIALATEQGDQPPFRRYSYISAFGEGWALYAEHLGVEMGIYETPYEHFGRLTYEMWRAARLLIDTGIHAKGWSRERSVQLLRENTALSELEVENEIDRYISWPGQALSYKLGELKIRELRAQAERDMGERFDLRQFHDTVLSLGSVPLPILQQRIEAFIQAK